jgi:transcription elongation factor S-II
LRTHEATEVSDLAKEIVKKWKGDVDEEKKRKREYILIMQYCSSWEPLVAAVKTPARPSTSGPRNWKSDGIVFPSLGDKTRDACRNLIYDALAINSGARTLRSSQVAFSDTCVIASDLIESRSTAVEEAVFNNCNNESNSDYRTKMRSLYLNLKGKENPSLREGVVSGDIPAKQLAVMSSAVRSYLVMHTR